MEKEKRELSEHLKATEVAAREKAEALSAQIAKEKEATQADMARVEKEKLELALKLKCNEEEMSRADDEKQRLKAMMEENEEKVEPVTHYVLTCRSLCTHLSLTIQAKGASQLETEKLAKERDDLQAKISAMEAQSQAKLSQEHDDLLAKIKEMTEEKEQLESAVKRQHEQVNLWTYVCTSISQNVLIGFHTDTSNTYNPMHTLCTHARTHVYIRLFVHEYVRKIRNCLRQEMAREKAAAEKLAQERDELMKAVQRMKDELVKEREEKSKVAQEAAAAAEKAALEKVAF